MINIAVIQMNSGTDREANLETASRLTEQAVSMGAELICLPESFSWLGPDREKTVHSEEIPGPSSEFLKETAKHYSVSIQGGSFFEKEDSGKCTNTSLFITPEGEITALYRKIHLFDAVVHGRRYHESETVLPGSETVTATIGDITFGFSICYDLRFPELFRKLSRDGAQAVFVPAAFTACTGKAHWEVLLRARAIENQVYIIAAAQAGIGEDGREYYGNSMIIDPWGRVTARADSESESLICGQIDPDLITEIRERIPVLKHRRL